MVPQGPPSYYWAVTQNYQVELRQTYQHDHRRESFLGSLVEVHYLLYGCFFLKCLRFFNQVPQPSRQQKMLYLEVPHCPIRQIQLVYQPPVDFSHLSVTLAARKPEITSKVLIPIDFKIKNFSYTCLSTFLVTIIIFGELTSTTSNETMTTDIIFVGATPIN